MHTMRALGLAKDNFCGCAPMLWLEIRAELYGGLRYCTVRPHHGDYCCWPPFLRVAIAY